MMAEAGFQGTEGSVVFGFVYLAGIPATTLANLDFERSKALLRLAVVQ